jgi:TDG/mug DNA glycosylase family protein
LSMGETRHIVHPFAPVMDPRCTVLILGSVPSVRSVEEGFYYMHPKNRFWLVLGALTGEDYAALDFSARGAALIRHGIGLYDAVYECDIMLSSDAKAKNIVPADIPALIGGTRVQRIFCNGALSYATLVKYHPSLEPMAEKLPSTSPANASYNMPRLIAAWQKICEFIQQD